VLRAKASFCEEGAVPACSIAKTDRAAKAARLALDAGDNDSAVSKSCYAMFDMARTALKALHCRDPNGTSPPVKTPMYKIYRAIESRYLKHYQCFGKRSYGLRSPADTAPEPQSAP
jgi:uncharacterized protein (UPF0332 family)